MMVRNEKPTTPRVQSRDELIKLCRGVSKNAQVIRALVGFEGFVSVKKLSEVTGFCDDDVTNAITVGIVQRGCLIDKDWIDGRVIYSLVYIGEKIQRESDERYRSRSKKARGRAAFTEFNPKKQWNVYRVDRFSILLAIRGVGFTF